MSLKVIEEDGFIIENNNREIFEYQKSIYLIHQINKI